MLACSKELASLGVSDRPVQRADGLSDRVTGADPTGADPTGADPTGADPSQGLLGRGQRALRQLSP